MNPEFGISTIVGTLGLSTFVLGCKSDTGKSTLRPILTKSYLPVAFGPLFLSPLSEFYGRRPVYIVSW